MSAFDDMPVGTSLLNRLTGTTFIKTHHVPPLDWQMIPLGRSSRRVASKALSDALDLVPLTARPLPLVDGQGSRWNPAAVPVYRIHPDDGLSDWLTRAQIEAEFGPVKEATP